MPVVGATRERPLYEKRKDTPYEWSAGRFLPPECQMNWNELQTTKRVVIMLASALLTLLVLLSLSYRENTKLVDTCALLTSQNDFLRTQNSMLHRAYTKLCNSGAGLTLTGGDHE